MFAPDGAHAPLVGEHREQGLVAAAGEDLGAALAPQHLRGLGVRTHGEGVLQPVEDDLRAELGGQAVLDDLELHGPDRREHGGLVVARSRSTAKAKQFRRGIDQLDGEGVIQVLVSDLRGEQAPVLAAVGPLQFEVVTSRLESEFRAPVTLEHLGYSIARRTDEAGAELLAGQSEVEVLTRRSDGALLAAFSNKWRMETIRRKFADLVLEPLPAGSVR